MYDDLTVAENLRYFAAVLGVGRERGGRVLDTVDLGRTWTASQPPVRWPAGRVSLAVALLGSPRLLVLDEPTVGLDPVLRRDLWRTVPPLADAGAAVLVSSHVMDEAERCDRLLLMREGRPRRRHPGRTAGAHRRRRRRGRVPGAGRAEDAGAAREPAHHAGRARRVLSSCGTTRARSP